MTRGRLRYLFHATAGMIVVALCGYLVRAGEPLTFETDLFEAINGGPDSLQRIAWLPMQFGNLVVVPLLVIGALAFRKWRLAIALAIVGVGKLVLEALVKSMVVRHRPAQIMADVILRDAPATGRGFLSGHAVIAVGVATVAYPYLSSRWRVAVWTLAAVVIIGRVYVGAHLPLDVVAGAALGWSIGSIANLITLSDDVVGPRPQ